MCIIPDACAIGDLNNATEHAAPVLRWLKSGKGGVIIGGELRNELKRSHKLMKYFAELDAAGKAKLHSLDDAQVAATTAAIKAEKICKSNDPHVIAVARLSGCRLIFSMDQDLGKDAKNKDVLDPPASIYKFKDHDHLLKDCKCGA